MRGRVHLGDIIGSPAVVFLFGWKLFGLFLYAKYVVNYVLAYARDLRPSELVAHQEVIKEPM